MPKAKAKANPYDRAAILAVATTWAQNIIDEIGRGREPWTIVGSAKVLTAVSTLAAEYESDQDPEKLQALQAIVASHAVEPQVLYEAMDVEDFFVTADVDGMVTAVNSGTLDD